MITIPLVEGTPVLENEPEHMTLKESKNFIFKVYLCLLFQFFFSIFFRSEGTLQVLHKTLIN